MSKPRRGSGRKPPPPAAAPPLRLPRPEWLLAILTACVAWDVFRIHFFADDFHFLDVARRIPLGRLLQGQHGIWPWYRPLSRELFFWLLVHAGPLATPLAHLTSIAVLWAAAVAVWMLARSIVAAPAAAIAPVLFLTWQFTKFLTGWASGFQDLLAIALILWAIVMHARGRRGLAIVLAGLAPFAKETGFVAGPLVIAWAFLCDGERRIQRWMLGHVAVVTAALAIHLGVRQRWTSGGSSIETGTSAHRLLEALLQVPGGFVTLPRAIEGVSMVLALGGAFAVWALVRPAPGAGSAGPRRGAGVDAFLILAALVGLAPMVVGNVFALTLPYAYHAFPALPWLVLLVARRARRAPAMAVKAGLCVLVIVNVAGLAFRAPNPAYQAFWDFRTWDWFEAVRLSEVNDFLSRGVRELMPSRPESLVVLYAQLPSGALFQSEDGPATREALRDPTVRAYYMKTPPPHLVPGRFEMVVFDPKTHEFHLQSKDFRTLLGHAATSVVFGVPRRALAWALYADSAQRSRFDLTYVRACALLMDEGPGAYLRDLEAAGYADTSGTRPAALVADLFGDEPALGTAYARVLSRPLTAAGHAVLAESLLARGIMVDAGVALRVATTLDPGRWADRLKLGEVLAGEGNADVARVEFQAVARSGDPALAARAQDALARLGSAPPPAPSTRSSD